MANKTSTRKTEKQKPNSRKSRSIVRDLSHRVEPVSPADALAKAMGAPASELSANDILSLQQTIGNRAVLRLLSSRIDAPTPGLNSPATLIQTKLTVGPSSDQFEQQADRIAKEASLSQSGGLDSRRQSNLEQQHARGTLAASITPLARQETQLHANGPLRAKRIGSLGGGKTDDQFESRLRATRGSGSPLPEATRSHMESVFGADFSHVRIHADPESLALNQQIGAQAFTHGSNIYFRPGTYNPSTKSGSELLAHELTHVLQQSGGGAGTSRVHRKVSGAPVESDIVQRQPGPHPQNEDELEAYQFGMDPEVYYGVPDPDNYEPIPEVDEPQGPGRLSRFGSAIASGARWVGGGIASGARAVGRGIASGVRRIGRGLAAGAQGARRGVELAGEVMTAGTRDVIRGAVLGAQAVGRGAMWVGEQAAAGVRATGRGIAAAGRAAGRGAMWLGEQGLAGIRATGRGIAAAGRAAGRGAMWLGEQGLAGIRATGRGIAAAGRATGRGAMWLGEQAVAGVRATGRGIAAGVRAAGEGLGWMGGQISQGARWFGRGARDVAGWLGSKFLGEHWGGSSTDQQVQQVGSRMNIASGVATAGGGIGTLISTAAVHGADEQALHPALQQADLSLRRESGTQTFSQVGQGFGAASGIASGLGGLVSMGSGLQNIGAEKRLSGRWLRRGIGRTTAGAGQVFTGMAAAGKGISAMTGATTAGAQFMTAAALPASIAMGGVDVLKGGWGTYKAYKSRQALERKQEELALRQYQVNHPGSQSPSLPKMAEFAEFAREYQGKRMGRKTAGMISGALGVAGGAMMLTGVGLLPGAIVAGLGGLIKVGSGLYGTLRDLRKGKEFAAEKKKREKEMAEFAGTMLSDSVHGKDMEDMLTSIGMEEKTIAAMKTMEAAQRKPFILAQLMRR